MQKKLLIQPKQLNKQTNKEEEQMLPVNLGISLEGRVELIQALQVLLANYQVVSNNVHGQHWRVVGMDFMQLHLFYDTLYDSLLENIDTVAERIRALGGFPNSAMSEYLAIATIPEIIGLLLPEEGLSMLLDNYEATMRSLRDLNALATKFSDAATANMVGDLIEVGEKQTWFIRAHIDSIGEKV